MLPARPVLPPNRRPSAPRNRGRTLAATGTAALGAVLVLGQVAGAPGAAAATSGLSLSATTSLTSVSRPGQQVDYAVSVRNRGEQSVHDLLVTDPGRGLSALVCSPVALGGVLGAGATTTCRASRTLTVDDLSASTITDTVKATAKPATGTTAVNAAVTVTVAVAAKAPVATDDTAGAVDGGPDAFLAGASNDRPGEPGGPAIDPARTVFTGVPVNAGDDGRQAGDEGGTWSTLRDGRVRMTPGFQRAGQDSTIAYRVYDDAGRSSIGHLRVHVRPGPTPAAHHATTPQGQAVTVDVLASDHPGQNADATPSAFDPATLQVNASSSPLPTTVAPDGTSVDLAGGGRFAAVDGKVVFTPAVGFVGNLTAYYRVSTTSGARLNGMLDVSVQPVSGAPGPVRSTLPVATDDHIVTTTQLATALPAQRNDVPGSSPFVNSKLTFPGNQLPSLPAGSTIVYGDGVTLTVPGQGTYLTRFGTQDVLFTPAKGFLGDATPVQYRVTDAAGHSATATLSRSSPAPRRAGTTPRPPRAVRSRSTSGPTTTTTSARRPGPRCPCRRPG